MQFKGKNVYFINNLRYFYNSQHHSCYRADYPDAVAHIMHRCRCDGAQTYIPFLPKPHFQENQTRTTSTRKKFWVTFPSLIDPQKFGALRNTICSKG